MKKDLIEKGGGFLTIQEAFALCISRGVTITKMGIHHVCEKNGGVVKIDSHRWYAKGCIEENILAKEIVKPGEGMVRISSLAFIARNKSEYYGTLKRSGIAITRYGRSGVRYAKEKDIRRVFEDRGRNDIEEKIQSLDLPD